MTSSHPQHKPRSRQKGFVLTIELLLITTVLIIGSFVGIVAIRDALFKQVVMKQSRTATVVDATGARLGPAIDFDEHDAPRIPYIDRTVAPLAPDPAHKNYRVLISVRDDRFTSREPLYYSNENCTGTPCIKSTSDELSDSTSADGIFGTGSVSYLNAMQGGPNYAVGASPDGIKGFLFRETVESCPVSAEEVKSRYLSKKVVPGSPCEPFTLASGVPANTQCLVNIINDCNCPAGTTDQGDILDKYLVPIDRLLKTTLQSLRSIVPIQHSKVDIGTLCCPAGTELEDDGNLVNAVVYTAINTLLDTLTLGTITEGLVKELLDPLYGEPRCVSAVTLRKAEQVPSALDPSINALEAFQAPFSVNLPADAYAPGDSTSGSDYIFTAPDQEG